MRIIFVQMRKSLLTLLRLMSRAMLNRFFSKWNDIQNLYDCSQILYTIVFFSEIWTNLAWTSIVSKVNKSRPIWRKNIHMSQLNLVIVQCGFIYKDTGPIEIKTDGPYFRQEEYICYFSTSLYIARWLLIKTIIYF